MKPTYNLSGFLKDNEYRAYISEILEEYKTKFIGPIQEFHLELSEIPYAQLIEKREHPIIISEDMKKCKVYMTFSKYYDNNGNETYPPSPSEIFQTLHNILSMAVKEYNEKGKHCMTEDSLKNWRVI